MSHTKEPWRVVDGDKIQAIVDGYFLTVVTLPVEWYQGSTMTGAWNEVSGQESDLRRIVACVNACEGIPTYQLFAEEGSSNKLGLLIEALKQQRDELLAELETAINRLDDMLIGDDGQAWKEAEKVMPKLRAAIAKVKP